VLHCSSFRKNLSAFLDGELSLRKRKQMELHISECASCREEAEKFRQMIGIIGGMERPEVPAQLWEGTKRRIQAASELPARKPVLGIPRWAFVPAAAVLAVLVYVLGGQLLFHKYETGPIPIAVYFQEHALSYSEQVLSSNPLSELAIVQAEQIAEETWSDEPVSELEMLMEVHYGTYTTNGS
jgi:anti-sigma factor RsiW